MSELHIVGVSEGIRRSTRYTFYEFARLVKEIEPKAFIYENVQGLMKHDKGRTWEVVQRVFDSLGYTLHTQILDAANYGIPQKRRRVFVVGFKTGGESFVFPPEKELKFTMQSFCLKMQRMGMCKPAIKK